MEVGIFTERNKSKSRVCCAVRDCKSKANKNLDVVFHKFPKAGDHKVLLENYFGNLEKVDKFRAWRKLLKINKVTPQMKICSLHFKKTDYILPDQIAKRRFLKKTAVPSCNLPIGFSTSVSEKIITPPSNLDMNEIVIENQGIEVDTKKILSTVTKIDSHKILENGTILSNQDLKDPLLIEYKDIKTEFVDKEVINNYEQGNNDSLDTEFMNENENTIIEEIMIKNENIVIDEIIIKNENIKIEQELHTEVVIKEESDLLEH